MSRTTSTSDYLPWLFIASRFIFSLWQLRQGVDSLAQWLEHWIFVQATGVQTPPGRWNFQLCFIPSLWLSCSKICHLLSGVPGCTEYEIRSMESYLVWLCLTGSTELNKRMHWHSGDFVRFCMRSDCCGCCQNKQDGGRQIFSLRRKTGWVFTNFLERWLHYKVNNHHITKNKPIYHARNVNRWKGSVEPRPFIGLLNLDVINRFIFGHGVVIYYVISPPPTKAISLKSDPSYSHRNVWGDF